MYDYQFTSSPESIDIKRVLKENVLDGNKRFVFVTIRGAGLLFLSKKMVAKIEKFNLLKTSRIKEEGRYGFVCEKSPGEVVENYVCGNEINSLGFTHYAPMFNEEMIETTFTKLKSVDELEAAESAKTALKENVRVIGG